MGCLRSGYALPPSAHRPILIDGRPILIDAGESRAWVLDRLMRHAQVCLGEIALHLKMRKAHSTDVVELETHQPDASAANRALELLSRELNLFTEKRELGKPGDFDHMADEDLMEFIEAQGEVVRELERQLLHPPAPKQCTTKY